ncbi:MAG TPA: T9SS type A sorting domain-containing protein, partial [Chitinophagales bacterium]|nr:T9SS type A sorting domain-containing protein [Chitinophagales bacterium]
AYADPPGIIDITPDQNIPYFLLCGFTRSFTEDFDNYEGYWIAGGPGDQATTGMWQIDQPEATYQVDGDPSSLVQTGTDHTTEGVNTNLCAFTGNNFSAGDPYNAQDVDNGATTLFSPVFDLSSYTNPAISYYRWYTNEASANPRNDHWKVFITNDNVNWEKVEWNNHPQRAWRNFVFHVSDYVAPNSTVQLKFVAEDSVIAGANLDGGSIVEAAVDDLYLWNEADNVGVNNVSSLNALMISPNPAANNFNVKLMQSLSKDATVQIFNAYGKVVYTSSVSKSINQLVIPVRNLESGIYTLQIVADSDVYTKKVVVQH